MVVHSTVCPLRHGHSFSLRSISFRILGAGIVTAISLLAYSFPAFGSCRSPRPAGSPQEERPLEMLVPGKGSEGELAGGQSHSYRIKLEAGQYLKVLLDQRGIDVIVTLVGPDGKEIVAVSPDTGNGPRPLYAIADVSGDYLLEVRSPDKKAPAGRYEARIEEMRIARADDKTRVTAHLEMAEARELQRQDTAEASRKALAKFEETLPLLRSLGDTQGEADSLHEAGELRLLLGDTQKPVDYFEQELPYAAAWAIPGARPTRNSESG